MFFFWHRDMCLYRKNMSLCQTQLEKGIILTHHRRVLLCIGEDLEQKRTVGTAVQECLHVT